MSSSVFAGEARKGSTKAVSAVIGYVLIFALAMSLTGTAYMYVVPRLSDMRSKSELEYMSIYMTKLDDKIKTVAHGGEGSQDYITFNIQKGHFVVLNDTESLEYILISNMCMESNPPPGVTFHTVTFDGGCLNRLILNYTTINITESHNYRGFVQLNVENLGFLNNKPLVSIV